jgi:PEP-utilising enzyme, PEP-binding domain
MRDTRVRLLKCAAIMYRLCDYNPDELTFLGSCGHRSRGAQRLIEDSDLLTYDLRMVETLLSAGVTVDILIPFVQFPEQLNELCARVRTWFDTRAQRPRRIGAMLELPANLFEVDRYTAANYFVFGPGDLLRFSYGGMERNDTAFEQTRVEVLEQPLRAALRSIDSMGGRTVFLSKALIDLTLDWDFLQFPSTEVRKLFVPDQVVPARKMTGSTPWNEAQ